MNNVKEKLDTICFWLIKFTRETNAKEMKVKHTNVTFLDENIGDWEIIVRKIK